MKTYTIIFFGSALVAIFGTPIVIRVARAFGLVDKPGVRKVHTTPVPRIGGVIVAFATLALVLPVFLLDNTIGLAFGKIWLRVVSLIAAATFLFLVGLIDDVRSLRARIKLLCQVSAALTVCAFGVRIDSVNLAGLYELDLGLLAWPLTVFWIVGITNAVNLIDGMDGLASGISAVACGVIAFFAIYTGQPVMAALMLALLGSLIGFLFFNFNPAKVFLGDCGTMFIGFVVSAASVMCAVKSETLVGLALPALALGLPIFDTLFSMLRRILERRSILAPDRKHIHHRLLLRGMNQRRIALFLYMVTLAAAGLGILMIYTRNVGAVAIFAITVLLILLVFRAVGAVRLRESLRVLRHNLALARDAKHERQCFEETQLKMREAGCFDDWWKAICTLCEKLDVVWVALAVGNSAGEAWTYVWRRQGPAPLSHDVITMDIPVGRKGPVCSMRMEAGFQVNGSLEAAGRRAGLLGRLIDECDLAGVPQSSAGLSRTAPGNLVTPKSEWSFSLREEPKPRTHVPPLAANPQEGESP